MIERVIRTNTTLPSIGKPSAPIDKNNGQAQGESSIEESVSIKVNQALIKRLSAVGEAAVALMQVGTDIALESPTKTKIANAANLGMAVAGVYLGITGTRELRNAIKKGDTINIIAASGLLGLSGFYALSTVGAVSKIPAVTRIIGHSALAALNSPLVGGISTGLGLFYAGSEMVEGGYLAYKGYKSKDCKNILIGGLNIGIGISAVSLYIAGGVPSAVALACFSLAEIFILSTQKWNELRTHMKGNHIR